MKKHMSVAVIVGAVAFGGLWASDISAQRRAAYTPSRTPWGHPSIEGIYTNKDEANTPLERPDQFKGRTPQDFTAVELARLATERQVLAAKVAPGIGGFDTGAGPTHWYEHLQGSGSRPWLITDPPDGKLPAFTPEAQRREDAMAAIHGARRGEGRADSWVDRSLYDRCITRGLPGSMMPAIYGNAYQILQTPDAVVIRYEMIHESRVIPLDPVSRNGSAPFLGRPHVGGAIKTYMGVARGRWEGNTLVVETTNFTSQTHFGYNNRYNSERLRLVERFTPISDDQLLWEVTFDDADTWSRPWTFAMPLTRDDTQAIFEYACHEGNRGLENILRAARAEDQAAARRR